MKLLVGWFRSTSIVLCLLFLPVNLLAVTDEKLQEFTSNILGTAEKVIIDNQIFAESQAMKLISALVEANSNFRCFAFRYINPNSRSTSGVIEACSLTPSLDELDLTGTHLSSESIEKLTAMMRPSATGSPHSAIEILILDDALSTPGDWQHLFEHINDFKDLREISLKRIKILGTEKEEMGLHQEMCDALEMALGMRSKRLRINLTDCGFADNARMARFQENSPEAVEIICETPEIPALESSAGETDQEELVVSSPAPRTPRNIFNLLGLKISVTWF